MRAYLVSVIASFRRPAAAPGDALDDLPASALAIRCARFYALIGVPAVLLLCFVVAPFQGSDEPAHFLRAAAIANGAWRPVVNLEDVHSAIGRPTAGGAVDDGVKALVQRYPVPLLYDRHHRLRIADVRAALALHAAGSSSYAAHSNTAIYLPAVYAVPAAAVAIARALHLPVLLWLHVARLLGAGVGLVILFATIRRSGSLAPLMLVVALSPIMLFQLATVSADTLLLPCAVVFAALVGRLARSTPASWRESAALGLVAILLAAAKIAYLPLLAVPPLTARIVDRQWSPRARDLAAASLAGVGLWLLWAHVITGKVFAIRPASERVDVGAQLATMVAHPFAAAHTLIFAVVSQLPNMIIQLLGSRLSWYEVKLPPGLIVPGLVALGLAATGWPSTPPNRKVLWLSAAMAAACYGLVYLAVYLQNNPVGAPTVGGMQGRYFLPLAVLLLALTPRLHAVARFRPAAMTVILAWCVASPVVTLATLIHRYWVV